MEEVYISLYNYSYTYSYVLNRFTGFEVYYTVNVYGIRNFPFQHSVVIILLYMWLCFIVYRLSGQPPALLDVVLFVVHN